MNSVKSVKRGRKEIAKEKKEIVKRLQKLKKTHDHIIEQMNEILQAANNAGTQLIDETSKSKFWAKLGPLTSIIAQSYGRFINIASRLPGEDGDSSDSSDSSQASLESIMSLESLRSSMSVLACGTSTSNASSQTSTDAQGAGDAKAIKISKQENSSSSQLSPSLSQESSQPIRLASDVQKVVKLTKIENIIEENCQIKDNFTDSNVAIDLSSGNGFGTCTERESLSDFSTESVITREREHIASVDSTPRAVCSADGVYRLSCNSKPTPLVSYDTESLSSYERENYDDDDLEEVPEMVELKQSDSTKLKENQSANSSASSSNETCSFSFSSLRVYSPHSASPPRCSIGSKIEVLVLDVQTPYDFWVQFITQHEASGQLDLLISQHCNGPNAIKPGKNLSVGLHCCVWDEAEELWFRAEVKRICYNWEDESPIKTVEVRYLDVGTLNVVKPDKLCSLSKECADYPTSAMHCKLDQLVPYDGAEWSNEANALFHNWLHENEFQMTVIDFTNDGQAVVELEEKRKGSVINIGKRLIEKKLAKQVSSWSPDSKEQDIISISSMSLKTDFSDDDNSDVAVNNESRNRFTWNAEIPEADLPTESEFWLIVTHINSPSSFYGILNEKIDDYKLMLEQLEKIDCKYNENVLQPLQLNVKINTYWAAKHTQDQKWYRAMVLAVKKPKRGRRRSEGQCEHSFFVYYVDYGDKEWVKIRDIRPLLECHCESPAYVNHFALAHVYPNLPNMEKSDLSREKWEWPKEAFDKFKELIGSNSILVGKIVPERSDEQKNLPIPIKLGVVGKMNSATINDLLFASGLAVRESLYNLNDEINKHKKDELSNWDPLKDENFAMQCYGCDVNDLSTAFTGYKPTDDQRICVGFNRGLCKDPLCRYEHTYFSDITTDKVQICVSIPNVADFMVTGMTLLVLFSAIETPGHFFVILPFGVTDYFILKERGLQKNKSDDLSDLMIDLNKYCNSNIRYDNPNIFNDESELIAAKSNNKWYRLRVIEYNDVTITGVKVDYGDIIEIAQKDAKPLSIQFTHLPSQAVECYLSGVEPIGQLEGLGWSEEAMHWFEDAISAENHYFLITIDSIYDQAVYVTIYDPERENSINDELISNGFAKRTDTSKFCQKLNK